MKKVNWPDNIRVDGPDLRAVLDIVAEHFEGSCQYLLGESSTIIHCGVITGMQLLVDVGLPSPLEAAIVSGGAFVDGARKFLQHSGTTSLDISGVAGTDGAKVWARVAATQLQVEQEDRVIIQAGAETTQPSYTRLVDQLEWTATTGAAPAGTGWALVLTIDTWVLFAGVLVPQNMTRNFMWFGYSNLYLYLSQVRDEIAEIKGVAAASWTQAPAQTIPQLTTRMGTAEGHIAALETDVANLTAADAKSGAKMAGEFEVVGGMLIGAGTLWRVLAANYIGVGIYEITCTVGTVDYSTVLGHCIAQVTHDADATVHFVTDVYPTLGGKLDKVRVETYDGAGNPVEVAGFRFIVF